MKTLLSCLFVLFTAFLSVVSGTSHPIKSKVQEPYGFTADSGYILKKQAIDILTRVEYESYIDNGQRDTIDFNPQNIELSDTIGKFYKLKNGKILACIEDIIRPDRRDTKVLIELDEKGTVLNSEGYFSGMYHCCWSNRYEGFRKHGDYFTMKTCGTGLAHCSTTIHPFKEFTPQVNGIYSDIWTGFCEFTPTTPIACHLTSNMEIHNDTITMHYTMEHLKERRNGKYKVIGKEKFDIKYIERESGWVALDSTKIRKFPD